MSADINRSLLVIGYGSLLSGYGILALRRGGKSRLVARDAFPVTLKNAQRGLAKPSSHGHYLAMDLEPISADEPIVASADCDGNGNGIGALALVFDREWAGLIARREEYDPEKFLELLALADKARKPFGEFLYEIAESTNFNLLAYRTALREMLGYTSHGYIFHPVPFEDGRIGIAAIGSGFEGSGDPAVRSKRNEYGMNRLLPLHEALGVNTFVLDRDGQIGYFVECALGGVHGVRVSDLIDGLKLDPELRSEINARFAGVIRGERAHFMEATTLDDDRYSQTFNGGVDQTLAGLLDMDAAALITV